MFQCGRLGPEGPVGSGGVSSRSVDQPRRQAVRLPANGGRCAGDNGRYDSRRYSEQEHEHEQEKESRSAGYTYGRAAARPYRPDALSTPM
jgi:hypothetical protein